MNIVYPSFGPPPTEADNANHPPTTDDPWWQESVPFIWGDPRNGHGGWLRLGVHPNQNKANLYAWIVWEGRTLFRRLFVDQPLPSGDLTSADIAGASVRTVRPLMEYDVAFRHGALDLSLRWRTYHWPVSMTYNIGGATITAGHYNMMGEVEGRFSLGGETFRIGGAGFSDHSWGVRRSHVPASRSIFAVFSPDFYVAAMPILGGDEQRVAGYVRHGDKLGALGSDCRFGYSIAEDWVTVAGCDAHIWDEHDRGFHFTGRSIGPASSQPMGHGKLVHHAIAEFECGGLIGRGILETAHPKIMRPSQIAELGLPADSWWLNDKG